jgi:peptidoglycan/LPS O-acetylase OafA/YrhL
MQERNHTLNLLRFLAALVVVFFHYNTPATYSDNFYKNFVKFGWLGVPIFFVISGYCILMSALSAKTSIEFIFRRLFRIYPTYWFSMFIVCMAALFQWLWLGANSATMFPRNLSSILSCILLYIDPVSETPGINIVYWSLACEICFYLTVFLGLLFPRKYMLTYFCAISILSICFPIYGKGEFYYFLKDWPCFALGLCLYYLHNIKTAVALTRLFFFLILIALLRQNPFGDLRNHLYLTVSGLTFLGIYVSTFDKFRLRSNIFSRFGEYSYSVYLIHVPIGVNIIGIFKTTYFQQDMKLNFLYDLFSFNIVLLCSYFMFTYIESPSIVTGKRISKQLNKFLDK